MGIVASHLQTHNLNKHPKMDVSREELLENIKIHIKHIDAYISRLEQNHPGEPIVFHPLLILIKSLANEEHTDEHTEKHPENQEWSEEKAKQALGEFLGPQFPQYMMFLKQHDMLRVSCVMLIYQAFPEMVTKTIVSSRCGIEYVSPIKEIVDDIFGHFHSHFQRLHYSGRGGAILGNTEPSGDLEDAIEQKKQELIREIKKRFQWYMWMGLDLTCPGFAYLVALKAVRSYKNLKYAYSDQMHMVPLDIVHVDLCRFILVRCLEKGLDLGSVDQYCRNTPRFYRDCRNGYCHRPAHHVGEIFRDECCTSCDVYEIVYVTYRDYQKEVTLFDLLTLSLAKNE